MVWKSRENKEGFVHGATVPWLKEAEASSKEARGCGNQRTQETEAKACRERHGLRSRQGPGQEGGCSEQHTVPTATPVSLGSLYREPVLRAWRQEMARVESARPLLLSYMKLVQQDRAVRIPFYSR